MGQVNNENDQIRKLIEDMLGGGNENPEANRRAHEAMEKLQQMGQQPPIAPGSKHPPYQWHSPTDRAHDVIGNKEVRKRLAKQLRQRERKKEIKAVVDSLKQYNPFRRMPGRH